MHHKAGGVRMCRLAFFLVAWERRGSQWPQLIVFNDRGDPVQTQWSIVWVLIWGWPD